MTTIHDYLSLDVDCVAMDRLAAILGSFYLLQLRTSTLLSIMCDAIEDRETHDNNFRMVTGEIIRRIDLDR
jgi:hypothetical protein